jgi:non-homologous end joining protein Ku
MPRKYDRVVRPEGSTAQRAAASDVAIGLGLIRTTVDVVPARRSDGEAKFKLICPHCTTPTRGAQTYICTHDEDHQFTSDEADRAIEVDKVLKRVTTDEIAAIKETDLPPGEINFTPVPAAEIEAATLPSGALYRLRPKADNDQAYGLFAAIVSDPAWAFIGELTMRSSQKFYRASVWKGQVVLQELVRPSEFHDADSINITIDPRLAAVSAKLVETLAESFDPEAFANRVRDRALALAEAKRSGAPAPAKPKPVKPTADPTAQLLAMLEGSIAAAEAAKVPAKKAPAKKKAS